ncbi:unnamed protein product [Fraxinus pennsylvanica]|uniref:Uncharacterized protein n=1 Tax=Fraxinus pennsylvanica TaxID=56036 RepID=A0AAD1ZT24_9LAMI|nr:unnamed protein product [Fraxinus pennsylvanica]
MINRGDYAKLLGEVAIFNSGRAEEQRQKCCGCDSLKCLERLVTYTFEMHYFEKFRSVIVERIIDNEKDGGKHISRFRCWVVGTGHPFLVEIQNACQVSPERAAVEAKSKFELQHPIHLDRNKKPVETPFTIPAESRIHLSFSVSIWSIDENPWLEKELVTRLDITFLVMHVKVRIPIVLHPIMVMGIVVIARKVMKEIHTSMMAVKIDTDECQDTSRFNICEHKCENTLGSF